MHGTAYQMRMMTGLVLNKPQLISRIAYIITDKRTYLFVQVSPFLVLDKLYFIH